MIQEHNHMLNIGLCIVETAPQPSLYWCTAFSLDSLAQLLDCLLAQGAIRALRTRRTAVGIAVLCPQPTAIKVWLLGSGTDWIGFAQLEELVHTPNL